MFVVGVRCWPAYGTCVVSWAPRLPPAFSVPTCDVGVCAGPWSRLCPALLSWVVGVCFLRFFFCFPAPGLVVAVSPSPFFRAGLVALSFFFLFRCPFSRWAAVPVLVLPVLGGSSPCAPFGGSCLRCLLGGGFGRLWGCWRAVWRLWAVFAPFPRPPPFFFFACLFLPLPSLGWCTHWPAFSAVFRAAVFSCVLFGRAPAPWVGWAMYTVGSAPLLAGLGPGSAGWAAAPGGCLWFWVRGLGLFVSFPLCGAGFNLLGGPPPLLPGALWPRVWPAVLVCGVLVRGLPGCAVAGFS